MSGRKLRYCVGRFEIPARAISTRMHHALRDTLVIEVKDLLTEVEVLKQCGTSRPDFQRVLVVRYGNALRCRHALMIDDVLMCFSALPRSLRTLHRVVRFLSLDRGAELRFFLRHGY